MQQRYRLISLIFTLILIVAVPAAVGAQDHASLQFVDWVEPNTQLMRAQVPQGWNVNAGFIDLIGYPQPNVVAVSPDQSALVVVGPNQAHAYAAPNPQLGLTEGTQVPLNAGGFLPVAPLMTPVQFLGAYLEAALVGSICSSINVQTDVENPVQDGYSSGEVTVTCSYSGAQATGRFAAAIQQMDNLDFGSAWMVVELYGFLADAGKEAEAEAALLKLVSTLSVDEAAAEAYIAGLPDTNAGYGSDVLTELNNLSDQMMAQTLSQQVDQMARSHMLGSIQSSLNHMCETSVIIMGGSC